jgi:hypothetical protein
MGHDVTALADSRPRTAAAAAALVVLAAARLLNWAVASVMAEVMEVTVGWTLVVVPLARMAATLSWAAVASARPRKVRLLGVAFTSAARCVDAKLRPLGTSPANPPAWHAAGLVSWEQT